MGGEPAAMRRYRAGGRGMQGRVTGKPWEGRGSSAIGQTPQHGARSMGPFTLQATVACPRGLWRGMTSQQIILLVDADEGWGGGDGVRGGNNINGWRQIVENNDVTDPLGGVGVRGREEGGVPIGGFNKIYAVAEGLRSFPGTRLHRDREEAPEPGRGKSRPPTWREEGHTGGRGGVGLGIRTLRLAQENTRR